MRELNIRINLEGMDVIGAEAAQVLRKLADTIEVECSRPSDGDQVPLFSPTGEDIGEATFNLDHTQAEVDYQAEQARINRVHWDLVEDLTRDDIVLALTHLCAIQCFGNETTNMLRNTLVLEMNRGITSEAEIREAFASRL